MRREWSSSKLGLVADLNSWYFKEAALIDRGKFSASATTTHCGWKGMSALVTSDGMDTEDHGASEAVSDNKPRGVSERSS